MTTTSEATKNPQSRHHARGISSPWANVVRSSAEPVTSSPLSPSPSVASSINSDRLEDASSDPLPESYDADMTVGTTKKPAWSRPSNGVVESGPVMGAESWPALSESSRTPSKSSFSDSARVISDGSISMPQVPPPASSPKKPAGSSPVASPNHAFPVRQKSFKRGDRGPLNTSLSSINAQPVESSHCAPEKPATPNQGSSPRDVPPKGGNWGSRGGVMLHSHAGSDQMRYPYRNGNGGHYPRGDGHHHGYGNRRDQERGCFDWNPNPNPNPHRVFNSKDVHMQQARPLPRGFIRPHPSSAPFIPPPPPPYGNPMCFPEIMSPVYYVPVPHPDAIRGIQLLHHPGLQPVFFPAPDPHLQAALVMQIDYYFSPENLCKDIFLRQNMDEHGWVPVSLIAGFNRVRKITTNVSLILEALQTSTVVEVQGDKIRKRNDWMNWMLPPQALSNYDALETRFKNVSLEEATANQSNVQGSFWATKDAGLNRSSSGATGHSVVLLGTPGADGTCQNAIQAGNKQSLFLAGAGKAAP